MNDRIVTTLTAIRDFAVNRRKTIQILLLIFGALLAYMVHKTYEVETEVGYLQSSVDVHYSTGNMIKMYGRAIFDGLTFGLLAENGMVTEAVREEEFLHGPVADLNYKKKELVFVALVKNFSGICFLCLAVLCGIGFYEKLKRRKDCI